MIDTRVFAVAAMASGLGSGSLFVSNGDGFGWVVAAVCSAAVVRW